MNAATFLKQFEHLAEAPNGIAKLRELILQLAVRGKLVPQDPSDEPASELLKKIQAEKQHLIAEGVIRKPKPLPPIEADELPYALTGSWQWIHLGDCTELISGQHLKPAEQNTDMDGIPYLTGPAEFGDQSPAPTRWTTETRAIAQAGDLLLTVKGSGVGKTNIVDIPELAISRQLMALRCIHVARRYVLIWLQAKYDEFQALKLGIAIPGIGRKDVLGFSFPLPPIAEQKRIIAKVEELMTLCDELEAKQQAVRTKQIALNRASLHALAEPNGTSLAAAWPRIRDHFDHLYTLPETVADLRQTILQLAVMGRLVSQDPNDEPASELLKKIQAEKQRLIAEGKIRRPKPLPPIGADVLPFELPGGWKYVRLGVIADIGTGSTPSRAEPAYWVDGTQNWVTSAQTGDPFIEHGSELVTTRAISECRLRVYSPGTLIVALYGQGKTRGQISELRVHASVNQACAAIQYPVEARELREYTKILFRKMYHEIREQAAGGAQPNLNVGKITQIIMPLPPIAEQKRIIAKVDQLMTLCNDLEAKLQQSQTDADNLLTAIVHELSSSSTEGD